MEYLSTHLNRLSIMMMSFLITALGSALLIQYGNSDEVGISRFIGGAILIWSIGSPMCQVVALLAFSDVVGKETQGIMMGWFTVAGSLGSIFCRLISGHVDPIVLW